MTLRGARILSSANDASVKTEQNTNINIKFKQQPQTQQQNQPVIYPTIPPVPQYAQGPVNFTQPLADSQYPSAQATAQQVGGFASRDVTLEDSNKDYVHGSSSLPQTYIPKSADFEQILEEKDKENSFLTKLLQIYQDQPIILNSYVICKSSDLMSLIKILTDCDKVDLILDEDIACGGCGDTSKLIYISKILITKDDKTTELKYGYNEAYSKLVANGISLKIVK